MIMDGLFCYGCCKQNDIHSPYVIIYESLFCYGLVYRLKSISKPEREALVGLPGVSGLSTEQRKRLTITIEVVGSPSIIFMDEPTSGLNARTAAIVMRTVRSIVDTGRTIVCTIHQPSIDVFEAFDELFILKRGGREIYGGSSGHHCNHLIEYFERIEGVGKIKDRHNLTAWMLEVTTSAREMDLNVDFADIYTNSELHS
ncbi:ABC transporter G family member 40 [Glycine soja]|uniref:ABC transporter G family member 40 n=1 Tax=Glycine soja TaxID=3848 RepID=A0A445GGG5_GLYSO|nr:ABC transporter G family member 40 [Glycine soja]